MSTINQIRANQQNAQLSTGPRSSEGKAVVRRNALKSGIHAVAATALPFEKLEELEALKNELYDQYDPATPVERDLVDDLIRDRWLLRRFVVIEDQLMAENWDARFKQDKPQFAIGRAYNCNDQTLARLHRRVIATKKSYKETLILLEKMQAARVARDAAQPNVEPADPPQTEPLPACPADQPAAVPVVIGFVPSPAPNPGPEPIEGAGLSQ